MKTNQKFYMEGNNGGDYITLKQVSDDELIIEVGACCVVTIRHKIPVELLTQILSSQKILPDNKVHKDYVKNLGEQFIRFNNKEYNEKLKNKITKHRGNEYYPL